MANAVTTKFRAVLEDGREIEGKVLPLDLVMAERQLGNVQSRPIETSFYAAWLAAKRLAVIPEALDFPAFINGLQDYQEIDAVNGSAGAGGEGQAPAGGTQSQPSPTTVASPQAI